MERLTVRFCKGLPNSITRSGPAVGDDDDDDDDDGGGGLRGSFKIPKTKRLRTLQFMQKQPQYVLKRRKSSWDVLGTLPSLKTRRAKVKGGSVGGGGGGVGAYDTFLNHFKKVLQYIPEHALSRLPPGDLEKNPRVKHLYERHFQNSPKLISYESVLNVLASDLLNYDANTGAVRESIADVRLKKKAPTSTLSLSITQDTDFDRILLHILSDELSRGNIPMVFLKSSYFTARAQLQQLYQDNPSTFAGELERVRQSVEATIRRDYVALVNETNRIYLSKYPFQKLALQDIGLTPQVRGFSGMQNKLQSITQLSLTVPGSSGYKFAGLEEMSQTYASTMEAQLMKPDHFMHGLQRTLTNDRDFVMTVLKNSNRSLPKVLDILRGNSL